MEIFAIKEHEQVNLIIKRWNLYQNKKIVLLERLNKLILRRVTSFSRTFPNLEINIIDPTNIETIIVLNDCCDILSGNEDIFWLRRLVYIVNGLKEIGHQNFYEFDLDYWDNYHKTESLLEDLLIKFKIFETKFEAFNNYFMLYNLDNTILHNNCLQDINYLRFTPGFTMYNYLNFEYTFMTN